MRRAVCAFVLATMVASLAVRAPETRSSPNLSYYEPVSWSPAGRWVAASGMPDYSLMTIIAPVGDGSVTMPLIDRTAAWSPDGERMAGYDRFGQSLRIVSPDDGAVRSVGLSYSYPGSLAWAPDSSELAYETGNGLSVVRSDGSQERRLAPGGSQPAWSPDGRDVAFVRGSPTGCSRQVLTVTADGSAERLLATGTEGRTYPVWSPDGTRLAYGTLCSNHAYVINRDGSGERVVGDFGKEAFYGSPAVAWSFDGRWLSATSEGKTTLFEVDGTRRIVLRTDGSHGQSVPHWSPTADEILFSRAEDQGDVLVVGSVDGAQRVIGHGSFGDWSPDGTKIAVLHEMYLDPIRFANCAQQLRIVDLTGTVLAGLTPCRFVGTSGQNTIVGTRGPDVIEAFGGSDRVNGELGADRIFGGGGADRLVGGPGRDTIRAGTGADRVYARDGEVDRVYCGAGGDVVEADPNDVVSRDCERVTRR